MARIILIETSTALCSVALAEDGRIVAYKESETPRAQASLTAPFVKELLDAQGIGVRDCDAVCVSKGPGSYTGLRVGVSTAKGLCFGAGIPLIAVGTLDTLVYQADDEGLLPTGYRYVVPMVDARRMEVYTAVFTPSGNQLTDTRPQVIESLSQIIATDQPVAAESPASPSSQSSPSASPIAASASFADLLAEGPVLFIGDGAGKCREAIAHPNAHFVQCCPKASAMLRPAFAAWEARRFEDTAYFEPFYLKEFIATVPRKKLF
ncbi:MAG: tRNA (adenosine(37)-N6)-threonylcarbamoyltransferase complex dimerization subunit type 1 TsaB [Bacteroidales bacterium]|nr:tRNA (adenosine(37)-N6)-threonylcarbamoyltransferase complex dimerization subunit type 1 TsaB [Bacteroidales bacterium]MBR5054680.1 tRNA (adenosine(37)-N6)-threonylcarbamoyltransferase complex dimerization subunit type 1 TsaB [Bacteroidales bacterium]